MGYTVFDGLKQYFPYIACRVATYRQLSHAEIIATMHDGRNVLYDDFDKTIRFLPEDSGNMNKEEFCKEFGRRLQKRIIRKGLTQQEFAESCGISQPALNSYLTGKTNPSFYIVDKMAKVLGCSVDDLRYID